MPKLYQLPAVQASTKPSLVVTSNVLRVAPVPAGCGTLGWELGGMGHRKQVPGGQQSGEVPRGPGPGKTESPLSALLRGKDWG